VEAAVILLPVAAITVVVVPTQRLQVEAAVILPPLAAVVVATPRRGAVVEMGAEAIATAAVVVAIAQVAATAVGGIKLSFLISPTTGAAAGASTQPAAAPAFLLDPP
jgi:hypothetical protein